MRAQQRARVHTASKTQSWVQALTLRGNLGGVLNNDGVMMMMMMEANLPELSQVLVPFQALHVY